MLKQTVREASASTVIQNHLPPYGEVKTHGIIEMPNHEVDKVEALYLQTIQHCL